MIISIYKQLFTVQLTVRFISLSRFTSRDSLSFPQSQSQLHQLIRRTMISNTWYTQLKSTQQVFTVRRCRAGPWPRVCCRGPADSAPPGRRSCTFPARSPSRTSRRETCGVWSGAASYSPCIRTARCRSCICTVCVLSGLCWCEFCSCALVRSLWTLCCK